MPSFPRSKWILVLVTCALCGVVFFWLRGGYQAADQPYNRQTEIVTAYTQYEWWLSRWSDNRLVCQVYTDHEGWPTPNEVQTYCGQTLYQQWQSTKPCAQALDGHENQCSGLYLHQVSATPQERTILVDLPEAQAWLSLTGCDDLSENVCARVPSLLLHAEEPLPNEYILAINGTLDGQPFSCNGGRCEVPLHPTDRDGVTVTFWADSSYGDSSPRYQALVRVVDTGVRGAGGARGWYVDVLSDRWDGGQPVSSCAETWQAFPSLGHTPPWLASPDDPSALISNEPYVYLAGRLIAYGLADAAACPDGGLLANGWASACGLETARPQVDDWQNQFDAHIISAAQQTNIPAQLLKNLFAQESQFWPGAVRDLKIQEFGVGHLTEQGADAVLLWNPDFFAGFCPLLLNADACALGYDALDEESKALLRGAVTVGVNPECETCPGGIDLSQLDFSMQVFAETLQANCAQAGQVVENVTGRVAGQAFSYEDLWRLTLVNYHAGPGCLYHALQETRRVGKDLTWENIAAHFEPGCQTAVTFVENVTSMQPEPTPTPTIPAPTATPTLSLPPTPMPRPSPTPESSLTPVLSPRPPTALPSATPAGYPPPNSSPGDSEPTAYP
ncbi:MAG: hypothetical protein Fur0018_00260 [Anaerolineales bacterium]